MTILAIETSCDETSIAIADCQKSRCRILSNIISSQVKVHKKWGGVVPILAKREHQKNLAPVLKKALKKAGMLKKVKKNQKIQNKKLKEILTREGHLYKKLEKFLTSYQKPKIDSIAVTVGPGLEPALWVGVNFARALSYFWKLSVIPVNHIEGHIFANFIEKEINKTYQKEIFPAICLSVAGGHTQLILIKNIGKYRLLGETRDDAAGECFDKVAKILRLGYPGGPIISKIAKKIQDRERVSVSLPRPMIYTKDYDFSFSGLKTAALYLVKKLTANNKKLTIQQKREICFETQQAIIDVLIKKTLKAAKDYKVKTILLSGGVAANKELRKQVKEKVIKELPNVKCFIPDVKLCTDNAAMMAIAAYFRWKAGKKKNWKEIKVNANLKI